MICADGLKISFAGRDVAIITIGKLILYWRIGEGGWRGRWKNRPSGNFGRKGRPVERFRSIVSLFFRPPITFPDDVVDPTTVNNRCR